MQKLRRYFVQNKRLIVLTFEIFWIVVFLLDRITSGTTMAIPEFIYVNF